MAPALPLGAAVGFVKKAELAAAKKTKAYALTGST